MKSSEIKIQQKIPQQVFEYWLEILIMYKQSNRDEDVYLSERCLNKAVKWFQSSPEIQELMSNKELVNKLKKQVDSEMVQSE